MSPKHHSPFTVLAKSSHDGPVHGLVPSIAAGTALVMVPRSSRKVADGLTSVGTDHKVGYLSVAEQNVALHRGGVASELVFMK